MTLQYIGQALGKMDGINGWMFSTVRVLVLPLSDTLFSPTNVSSLFHVSKQNHSKAIHLSKDNKKERKKEEEEEHWST